MNELLEDITGCLEKLLQDLTRMQPTMQAGDRYHFGETMGRLSQACHETRVLAELLRLMKEEGRKREAPINNLQWTARLASLDTVNADSRN